MGSAAHPASRARPGAAAAALARCAACALACTLACADPAHLRLLEPGQRTGPAAPDDAAPALPDAPSTDAAASEAAVPDAAPSDAATEADAARPTAPSPHLALRYDFSGTGTRVLDRVGSAHAQVIGGAALDGLGSLVLDGMDDFVDMPNGILSRHESVTIVVWIEWYGDGLDARDAWQRIFDFGVSDAGEGRVGNAVTSLFMTPSSLSRHVLTAMAELRGAQQALVDDAPLPGNSLVQVALGVDGRRAVAAMYAGGRLVAQGALSLRLRDVEDANNWLGRSQWIQDLNLRGRYDEFRMYDGVLSAEQIAELNARGPDAL